MSSHFSSFNEPPCAATAGDDNLHRLLFYFVSSFNSTLKEVEAGLALRRSTASDCQSNPPFDWTPPLNKANRAAHCCTKEPVMLNSWEPLLHNPVGLQRGGGGICCEYVIRSLLVRNPTAFTLRFSTLGMPPVRMLEQANVWQKIKIKTCIEDWFYNTSYFHMSKLIRLETSNEWMYWCFNKTLLQMCLKRRWTTQAVSHCGERAALGQLQQWLLFLSKANEQLNGQINWTCPACTLPSPDDSWDGLQKTPGSNAECRRKRLQQTNEWTKPHSVAAFCSYVKKCYVEMLHESNVTLEVILLCRKSAQDQDYWEWNMI